MDLGPDLFDLLNRKQQVGNQIPIVYGAQGLSPDEIASIESELGFRLPDDFAYLLGNLQDAGGVLFPWSDFDKRTYDESIRWVLHGIEFDIEKSNFWLSRWGEKPEALSAALDRVREDFQTWPKLLPIHSHRFLAAEPYSDGNPVFSIMQTDIIYYGANLAHYLLSEFVDHDFAFHVNAQKIRKIEMWSDFAECRLG
jgi:hypothetical protein